MITNKELRAMARQQLDGSIFANGWMAMLLIFFIVSAINAACAALSSIGVGAVVILLVTGPLMYGQARATTDVAIGKEKAEVGDLFKGFSEAFGDSFLLGLMTTIYIMLWSLLFVIPGIIKSYSYALAPYIQQGYNDKDWRTALDLSNSLMNGHKWQLFCLDISFIGWYIVGAMCLGIGVLWVTPYHQTARANFYLEVLDYETEKLEGNA